MPMKRPIHLGIFFIIIQSDQGKVDITMSAYHPYTEAEAIELARTIEGIFSAEAELHCREIGDGNLNLVFHITEPSTGKGLIIKQALPYVKVFGESWPLSIDRSRIEAEALKIQHRLAPSSSAGYTPTTRWPLRSWRISAAISSCARG